MKNISKGMRLLVALLLGICCVSQAKLALTFKGGINPMFFTSHPNIFAAVTTPSCALSDVGKDRKFSQLFHNPGYDFGVEVAYSGCGYREIFGEFLYQQHNSLNKPFAITVADTSITASNKLKGLGIYSGFVGFRYFFERICCNKLAFFLGAKIGVSHYNEVKTTPLTLTNVTANVDTTKNTVWFNGNNTIAGGFQAGFDLILHGQFSLFCNAEVIASGALRSKAIIDITPQTDIPIIGLIRQTRGTLFSFPINIGLRYYFN